MQVILLWISGDFRNDVVLAYNWLSSKATSVERFDISKKPAHRPTEEDSYRSVAKFLGMVEISVVGFIKFFLGFKNPTTLNISYS